MENVRWPNLFIAGAPRSGTTSLFSYLSQHPEVFSPEVKEPRFFAFKDEEVKFSGPRDGKTINESTISLKKDYLSLYDNWEKERYSIDASPIYLYFSNRVASRIKKVRPDAKIILILRHPIERAYSDFKNMVKLGREIVFDFEKAVKVEKKRIAKNFSPFYRYTSKGFYAEGVENFVNCFGESGVFLGSFRELCKNTSSFVNKITEFLDIGQFDPETEVRNASEWPISKTVHRIVTSEPIQNASFPFWGPLYRLVHRLRRLNLRGVPPSLPQSTENHLAKMYKDDLMRLKSRYGIELERL